MWLVLALAALVMVATPGEAAPPEAALAGRVSSVAEGAMEGVLVTARRVDGPIAVTVASDRDGDYAFPAARLAPGRYALTIRAAGWDLDGGAVADIAPETPAHVDLTLRPTRDLAAQLTNADWLASFPGTAAQKQPLLDCMSCHTLERIARSEHDADDFIPLLMRMAGYANMSTPLHPQRRVAARTGVAERFRKFATYLASINLSQGPAWRYPLQTTPRPTGRATRAIVTEYAMPRATIEPHDVRMDAAGMLWFSDFGEQVLGRLDPATGAVTEFPIPELKPGYPTGTLDLEPDQHGNFWLALMYQGGLARFDPRTQTFTMFPLPPALDDEAAQQSMVMPFRSDIDGKVWTNLVARQSILRLDIASGAYELFDPFKDMPNRAAHSPYGLVADAANDLYFMDFGGEAIGRIDAKTGQATLYPTPTPQSRPRRGMIDEGGVIWFAEYEGNRVGSFDTKAERFAEWPAPLAYMSPYDATRDRNGELWSASQTDDRVLRLDPGPARMSSISCRARPTSAASSSTTPPTR